MKQYNEAYEVLIDEEKRRKYDELLKNASQEVNSVGNNTYSSQSNINDNAFYRQEQERVINEINQTKVKLQEELRQKAEKEYNEAYEAYLRSLGYKIKYKRTLKEYVNVLLTILILIIICFIAWQIPFVRNYLISFYEYNVVIKAIVDVILRILRIT